VKRVSPEQTSPAEAASALLASPVRRAIVEVLERCVDEEDDGMNRAGGMTAAQLAERLGLHVTTVRFHLDQLDLAGLVVSHFTKVFGVGRPRKVYAAAVPRGGPDRAASHLKLLAGVLTASFASHLTPDQAGRQWARENVTLQRTERAATAGAWLTKLGRLIDVLEQWGYAPNLTMTEGGHACRIDLVDCPFMDLARANPEVVCGIHHGLLTGVLDQLGEDRVEVSLEPFVGPSLCHAHINTRQPFHPSIEEPPRAP